MEEYQEKRFDLVQSMALEIFCHKDVTADDAVDSAVRILNATFDHVEEWSGEMPDAP